MSIFVGLVEDLKRRVERPSYDLVGGEGAVFSKRYVATGKLVLRERNGIQKAQA